MVFNQLSGHQSGMLISSSLVPVATHSPGDNGRQGRLLPEKPAGGLAPNPGNRQTAEFIHRGEVEGNAGRSEQRYSSSHVDPANRKAIHRYQDTAAASINSPDRKGQMLDIFL